MVCCKKQTIQRQFFLQLFGSRGPSDIIDKYWHFIPLWVICKKLTVFLSLCLDEFWVILLVCSQAVSSRLLLEGSYSCSVADYKNPPLFHPCLLHPSSSNRAPRVEAAPMSSSESAWACGKCTALSCSRCCPRWRAPSLCLPDTRLTSEQDQRCGERMQGVLWPPLAPCSMYSAAVNSDW